MWVIYNHRKKSSKDHPHYGFQHAILRKVLFDSNLLTGCSVLSSENRPNFRSPVPGTALRHDRLTQRLMASQKAYTKSSCSHMCAALKPPSLLMCTVPPAASQIFGFGVRRQNGRPRAPAAARKGCKGWDDASSHSLD